MYRDTDDLDLDAVPKAGSRYNLGKSLGVGACGTVFEAADSQANGKRVAVKVQCITPENIEYIQDEYKVLKAHCNHPNLPEFYGVYRNETPSRDEIWFVMELCEGGTVIDLVQGILARNRRMAEEHIAFVLKETVKALIHLHESNIIHRDVRGSNILITREGEVKLVDFGISKEINCLSKKNSCIGSPCWMAPEVVNSSNSNQLYDVRADVWAVGITAIELADGSPPLKDAHPTRVMFQIARNPPPGVYRAGMWSNELNDFISECLEKNFEYRPCMAEIYEHPFLANVPENCYHLTQELKKVVQDVGLLKPTRSNTANNVIIKSQFLKIAQNKELRKMFVEDLAALFSLSEDTVLQEMKERMKQGHFQTFIGDILIMVNPYERRDIYGEKYHLKYQSKSRSNNEPHIYAVADSAYQDALHHEVTQHIIFGGETGSGKSTSALHTLQHLLFLGDGETAKRIQHAFDCLQYFVTSSTPSNPSSTRCIFQTKLAFSSAGKATGAIFKLNLLEKFRVSNHKSLQSNFFVFYYFYDAMKSRGSLQDFHLNTKRSYRYFNFDELEEESPLRNTHENSRRFSELVADLKALGFEDSDMEAIWNVLASVLILGDLHFSESNGKASLENPDAALGVAKLMKIDDKKFAWSLTNYCAVEDGKVVRKRQTVAQANESRTVLANNLYARLVDWIVFQINTKFAVSRAIFGDKYWINIFDLFGFECFQSNSLEQLLVNTVNEQLQYHYLQKVFIQELKEAKEECVPINRFQYYDNREALEELLGKNGGILSLFDEATKIGQGASSAFGVLSDNDKNKYVHHISHNAFSVAHFTGKIVYDAKELVEKNRDFLPPEVTETFRTSRSQIFRAFFTNKMTKCGNVAFETPPNNRTGKKIKWSSALKEKTEKEPPNPESLYSQTRKMRSVISVFKAAGIDMLRNISHPLEGMHFVRCIRPNLQSEAGTMNEELVRHQLRALAVVDTAKARQQGYARRIPFQDFLKRYQFLAFDFGEPVEITKENCRLLFLRLKMEGWMLGSSKVFLKYYDEEYLGRLYETQVKKIIKIQSMMRSFLAKRNLASKLLELKNKSKARLQKTDSMSDEVAALMIQKTFRGYHTRKTKGAQSRGTDDIVRYYGQKWRSKTIFQVLFKYKATKYKELVSFSQQVHIYNQSLVHALSKLNKHQRPETVHENARPEAWLPQSSYCRWKLPFHSIKEIFFHNSENLCEPRYVQEEAEVWDKPLRRKKQGNTYAASVSPTPGYSATYNKQIDIPFSRDPHRPIEKLPSFEPQPLKRTTVHYTNAPPATEKPRSSYNLHQNRISPTSNNNFVKAPFFNKPQMPVCNPINELKTIAREHRPVNAASSSHSNNNNDEEEDEPPFNFRALLRKTNTQRESLKRLNSGESMAKSSPETKVVVRPFVSAERSQPKIKPNILSQKSIELIPGITMMGNEVDL